MMNRIRQILSHKLRLSGIRGCMAAGAMTAGIAALAVIGGVNSEDISTVSLETDVIPEETAAQAVTEKKTYSHDMEYFSFEDMEKMTSKKEEAPEAAEASEELPAVNEAVNEPFEEVETSEEETAENDTAEDTEDAVSEEYEDSTASSEEQETVTDEEETASDEETGSDEEAEETASYDEYPEDTDENTEEYSDNTDNEPEQTEEAAEPEQEAIESVSPRISAAGGDDDNSGLSSALDLETEYSTEADDYIIVYSSSDPEPIRFNSPAGEEVPKAAYENEDMNDIPEDITLDDEDEIPERVSGPQEGAISRFDLPEWLTFDENGIPTEYVNVLTGNACAYTAAPDALMSTGKEVFQGYVAVDPDIIPYGSELYIVAEDGEVYGYAIAADTGYSVRAGDIIVDLFMNEYDDCIQWGNKPVYVYVLK